MDSACTKILSRYPELQFISETEKVRCTLSGHEMPCRIDVLKSYVSGKKFTKLKAHHDFDYSRYQPFLITSKKRKYQLFCTLTNRYLNRKPDEVKGHVSGRRYKQAMEKYNAGELKLFQERLKNFHLASTVTNAVDDGTEEEEPLKQQSSGKTLSQNDSKSESSSEGRFWSLPDSDSDDEAEEMEQEEVNDFSEEKTPQVLDISKKGRKRKGLTAQALAAAKKQKLRRAHVIKTNPKTKKFKKTS